MTFPIIKEIFFFYNETMKYFRRGPVEREFECLKKPQLLICVPDYIIVAFLKLFCKTRMNLVILIPIENSLMMLKKGKILRTP